MSEEKKAQHRAKCREHAAKKRAEAKANAQAKANNLEVPTEEPKDVKRPAKFRISKKTTERREQGTGKRDVEMIKAVGKNHSRYSGYVGSLRLTAVRRRAAEKAAKTRLRRTESARVNERVHRQRVMYEAMSELRRLAQFHMA